MVGFYMVLFVAAIKGIPAEVYEAARVDGAGRFRTAISITVPMIRDTIRTAYIYLGILALDAFVYMQALNSNGGPANSTLVISQDLLVTAFKKGKFGYASSMGATLAIITLVFAALVFLVFYLTGEKRAQKAKTVRRPCAAHVRRCPRRRRGLARRRPEPRHAAGSAGRRVRCRSVSRPVAPSIWTDKIVGGDLAHGADRLVDHRLRAAALGADVVVQDDQGNLRLALLAADQLELRQLRLGLDERRASAAISSTR